MRAPPSRRGRQLGPAVLVLLALTCGWPPSGAGATGKRTIRNPTGAVGKPQRGQQLRPARRAVHPTYRLSAALRRRALEAEPQVTAALASTLEGSGGALVDLDNRIKRSGSLLMKIRRDRREKGLSVEEAGAQVADVLRYKVVLPFARYEKSRRLIVTSLEGRGFAVVKSKDNWGTRYPGHNLQMRTAAGYLFELQFQTPASHEANQQTHDLYRRFREAHGAEAAELERRIVEITSAVPIPRGVGPQRPGMTRSNEVMTPR
ncbi:MAG TPA: hypothetical protein VFU21_32090 [Kofleriaceae bacterium]|nr:hypothetical protein [Kofleriaceae bacterium]